MGDLKALGFNSSTARSETVGSDDTLTIGSGGTEYTLPTSEGDDIRWDIQSVSDNNTIVDAEFELYQIDI